jgi:hypothetical protein
LLCHNDIAVFLSVLETQTKELNCVTTPETKNTAIELRPAQLSRADQMQIADGCPNSRCKIASAPTGPASLAFVNDVSHELRGSWERKAATAAKFRPVRQHRTLSRWHGCRPEGSNDKSVLKSTRFKNLVLEP